jgi:hypothetical protein
MKKQLNVDVIQSELRGGSAFFPGYKKEAPAEPAEQQNARGADPVAKAIPAPEAAKPATSTQGVPPPVPRTVPRTDPPAAGLMPKVKRPMKQRQPFDIYEDQYAKLRKIADAERGFVNGRGMSQMVREAIDAYLAADASLSNNKTS